MWVFQNAVGALWEHRVYCVEKLCNYERRANALFVHRVRAVSASW